MKKKTSTLLLLAAFLSLLPNVFAQKVSIVDKSPRSAVSIVDESPKPLFFYLIDVSPSMSRNYGTSSKRRIEVVKEKLVDHVKTAPNQSTIILYTFSGKNTVARKGTFILNSDADREQCVAFIRKEINYVLRGDTYLYSSIAKVQQDAETD